MLRFAHCDDGKGPLPTVSPRHRFARPLLHFVRTTSLVQARSGDYDDGGPYRGAKDVAAFEAELEVAVLGSVKAEAKRKSGDPEGWRRWQDADLRAFFKDSRVRAP